ncbi:MAG: hypothetical protein JW919_00335 [Candidatus Omnitrophica bacterium]|nr:hypothetical protein [Candidatus Omnitrophota bacterium]
MFQKISRGNFFLKSISFLLMGTFLITNVAMAVPQEKTPPAPEQQSAIVTPDKIVIPREVGIVKSRFVGKDPRFIINIQDAHCNYEAQSNIVKILESLIKNDKLSFVAVEGADGIIDTSWFKAFPDEDVRKEVAAYFMKKGEITGPEFLSITSDYDFRLFGAETREYYIKNLNAFTSSYPLKEATEKYYNDIKTALNRLKGYIYSDDLKAMDARIQDYETKKLPFNEYIRFLNSMCEKLRINIRDYDNFFKLVSTLMYEKKIDFKVVDKERSVLIDELSRKSSKDALTELVTQSLSFKVGKISPAEFYDYLKKRAAKEGVDVSKRFPNLANYIIYNAVYAKIENEKLFSDIKQIERAIKDKLFQNDDQRTLDRLSHHADVILNLINIKLLNDDYDYYETHKEEFEPRVFADFIRKQTARYGFAYTVEEPSEAVAKSIPRLEDFYSIAIKRNESLVDNTIQGMKKEGAKFAVLVTGGFHSEGMAKLLEKQGISYMIVCPSITKDVPTPYIQILTNQRTSFEDILVGATAAAAEPAAKGLLAPYVISSILRLGEANLKKLSEDVGTYGPTERGLESRVNDFLANYPKTYIDMILEKFTGTGVAFATIRSETLDQLRASMRKFRNIPDWIVLKTLTAAAARLDEQQAGFEERQRLANGAEKTPGTQAVGPYTGLTLEQAKAVDVLLYKSFADGTFDMHEMKVDGRNFFFVAHKGLLQKIGRHNAEAQKLGEGAIIPVNLHVHPGRGGATMKHAALQGHLDADVYASLAEAERRTIARHELAHLDIFNVEAMNAAARERIRNTAEYRMWKNWADSGRPIGDAQEEFVNSLAGCNVRDIAAKLSGLIEEQRRIIAQQEEGVAVKRDNVSDLKHVVEASEGAKEIIAITNEADAPVVSKALEGVGPRIFRQDGDFRIMAHEEVKRRGQWLGLLDAMKKWEEEHPFDRDSVSLGIMMPGQGTRFSPFTQAEAGIKPFFPMLIRTDKGSGWMSGAASSLYAWNLVGYHLKRMGFRGIAWKWGDEPQIAANVMAGMKMDLKDADIVRFGSMKSVTDYLAENKEWLTADAQGNLTGWARRRPKAELLKRLGIEGAAKPKAMTHIGSPAFSYVFIEEAQKVFASVPKDKWLDVDGYLIEALTMDRAAWEAEKARDPGIAKVLEQCPNFYELCQQLKAQVEGRTGHPLRIKVVDFGEYLYWGDIGSLAAARNALCQVSENTAEGEFARELAMIDDVKPDGFGNRTVGDCIYPKDGSVRNSVLVNTKLYGKCDIKGAVLVNSRLGNATIGKGSVVFGSTVLGLTMGDNAFSYKSVKDALNIETEWTHTSMAKNARNIAVGIEDWQAPSYDLKLVNGQLARYMKEDEAANIPRLNVGSNGVYDKAVFGNPRSFKEQQVIARQREVPLFDIEKEINAKFGNPLVSKMREMAKAERALARFAPLKFGTSGLRDFDANLRDSEVYINTRGFIDYLFGLGKEKGGIARGDTISLAADFRPTSRIDRIPRAVALAIIDSGCKIDWCGMVPTPTVTYYGMQQGRASIMVTGSHIAYGMNGIKFNRPNGEILKEEEKPIMASVAKVREQLYAQSLAGSLFDDNGYFKKEEELTPSQRGLLSAADIDLKSLDAQARALYIQRYKDVFGDILAGQEIVFYQQTAVGREILPEIFEALGAKVERVGRLDETQTFYPVDTEKMTQKVRDELRGMAKAYEQKYGHKPTAVITTDGDSDRPVFCDENGEFLPGDKLGVLTSMFLKPSFVALPVTCNSAAVDMLKDMGIRTKLTQVGSPYINKAMLDELAERPDARAAGYEANGGYLHIGNTWSVNGKTLAGLPTRDAALPLISSLALSKEKEVPVSELFKLFNRHTNAAVIDDTTPGCENYTSAIGKTIIQNISPRDKTIEAVDFAAGKVIRKDGKEAALSSNAELERFMRDTQTRLSKYFKSQHGFEAIARINYLDGVRIYFSNGDIVHLRPSGNMPEFRIYAEASTQARADAIVEFRTKILPQIIRDFSKVERPTPDEAVAKALRKTPGVSAVMGEAAGDIESQIVTEKNELAETLSKITVRRATDAQFKKGVVIIAVDDNLYAGAANSAIIELPKLADRSGEAVGVIVVRGRGEALTGAIADAAQKAEAKGLKVRNIVTQLSSKTYAAIKDKKEIVDKLGVLLSVNAQSKDLNSHYIQILRLFDLSLKIAYDFKPEDISDTLSKIIGKPVSVEDIGAMLANRIMEILPVMQPIDTSTAVEAYKAVKQALISL